MELLSQFAKSPLKPTVYQSSILVLYLSDSYCVNLISNEFFCSMNKPTPFLLLEKKNQSWGSKALIYTKYFIQY